jgi:signal transduction histidine kinase
MEAAIISDLKAQLAVAVEALRKTEEQAIAGLLALEVMHEIRNPLEALSNLTYLAIMEADDAEKVRSYLRLAEEQMASVRRVASQTLSFAKSRSSPKSINLVALAEAALRIHQRTIESKKLHLVKDLPEVVVAPIYTGEILQVISNVIVNALDALPEDGTLFLRLRKSQGKVHLTIADNGHGIPAEHIDAIFKPFFTTKEEKGTGLGLAISKRIIERHSGRIVLRSSVRPGKSGTLFRISLPA